MRRSKHSEHTAKQSILCCRVGLNEARPARRLCLLLVIVLFVLCTPAHAQWMTHTFTLNAGWNAVFLDVEPEPQDCATVFSGLPIDSVWYWSPNNSSVQFTRNPNDIGPDDPDWRVYFPETSLGRASTTLRVVRGNRPYLIKISGTASVNWVVRGKPSTRALDWAPNSYNLVGFSTDPSGSPTFQKLFAGSTAHTGQVVFRLSSSQLWEQVANPSTAQPRSGEAFWVYTKGTSTYQGPLRADLADSGRLDFGRGVAELQVNVWNDSGAAKTCTIKVLNSEAPPAGASIALAGTVPLSYWKDDYAHSDAGWRAQTASVSISVPTKDYKPYRLSVRRQDMAVPAAGGTALYQSVLQITDGEGMRLLLPVTAKGLQTPAGAKSSSHPSAGLWVGTATINKVSQPALASGEKAVDHTTPMPTGSEFQFTVLLHVDKNGQARLLQQVTLMWKDGTTKPDPDFPGATVVDVPGKYVLITDESRLSAFEGASMRGGVSVGRRFSTPVFGFSAPIDMTGTFPTPGAPANTVNCTVPLDYDDPLNPFKHKYHPDHNNQDEYYAQKLPDGEESWSITRDVSLEFVDYAANGSVLANAYPGWGDQWLGGTYRETITGLHRTPVYVEGTFRLSYVSDVAELNPEN